MTVSGGFSTTSALDAVDDALAGAARCEFVRSDQAVDILFDVYLAVSESSVQAQVGEIVGSAAASYCAGGSIDRRRIVDSLLDIRLVIAASERSGRSTLVSSPA